MNHNQIKAFIKSGICTRKPVGDGLYIRVQSLGNATWEIRYSVDGKRRFMAIKNGQYPNMSLAQAKAEAAHLLLHAKQGKDPLVERQKIKRQQFNTVDDLFNDWFIDLSRRLKHPSIPKRIYQKEIQPILGHIAISDVTPQDIRTVIQNVAASLRPSTANDTLMYSKQLFNHACKLGLIDNNPASAFQLSDAGGLENSRKRFLSVKEVQLVFEVFRQNATIFTRDNYLAVAMLLLLGVRKSELIAARWEEFDLQRQEWQLPQERSKSGSAITIPLPNIIIPWLKELKVRSFQSEYIFPARRASKRRGYISDDTLNHALAKLFGKKVDSKKCPYPNLMQQAGIEHFVIHDLRRTCRSLLSELNIPSHISERCLNHAITGVEGIYDRYDYLKERKAALTQLSQLLAPLLTP